MADTTQTTIFVLDENHRFTLHELITSCSADENFILELVQHGVLHPQGSSPQDWQFSLMDFKRSRKAANIQRDLEVNLPGIALALDLLEQIEELQQELSRLNK